MSWSEDIVSSIKYMERHLTDELTVERIAAKVNLSAFYFQKGFSILCGVTVSEYIRNISFRKCKANARVCKENACGAFLY